MRRSMVFAALIAVGALRQEGLDAPTGFTRLAADPRHPADADLKRRLLS